MKYFNRHIPYYYQIKEDIRQRIVNGTLKPGTKLSSEPDLATQYGVSRPTVRQALSELMQEGFLTREKGRGTFVSRPGIIDNAQVFTTFEDPTLTALVNTTRLLQHRIIVPPLAIAQQLDLRPDDQVFEITTVRGTLDERLAVRTSLIPLKLVPDLLTWIGTTSPDIYQILSEQYHLVPTSAEQRFQAIAASDKDATLLSIHRGAPLLLWHGLIYADHGIKMARVRTLFRGDRFSFTIRQGYENSLNSPPSQSVGEGILDTIDGRMW